MSFQSKTKYWHNQQLGGISNHYKLFFNYFRKRSLPTPDLFLDQTEARRAEKMFFWRPGPPPYLTVWMTGPPLSQSLDPVLLEQSLYRPLTCFLDQRRLCVECVGSRASCKLFRERLSAKMRTRRSRKVTWDMINTLFQTLYM